MQTHFDLIMAQKPNYAPWHSSFIGADGVKDRQSRAVDPVQARRLNLNADTDLKG